MVLRAPWGCGEGGSREERYGIHMRGDVTGPQNSRGVSVSMLESGRELGNFEAGSREVCLIFFWPRLLQVSVPLKGKTG